MIDAAEVERLRRMCEGETPFKSSGLYERLRRLEPKVKAQLPSLARLALAFYEGGMRRAERLKEL